MRFFETLKSINELFIEMNSQLKRKIESNDRGTRYYAIDELVKSANREAITFLIYIAKGLKRSFLRYYDFEDQVYAMEALIKTRSKEGIDFLKNFFEETIQICERPPIYDITFYIPKLISRVHLFENASGELGRRLYYHETLFDKLEKKSEPDNYSLDSSLILNTIAKKDAEAHGIRESILNKIKVLN